MEEDHTLAGKGLDTDRLDGKVGLFGVSFDPLPSKEALLIKHRYLEAQALGNIPHSDYSDPYDFFSDTLPQAVFGKCHLLGKVSVPTWLQPKPQSTHLLLNYGSLVLYCQEPFVLWRSFSFCPKQPGGGRMVPAFIVAGLPAMMRHDEDPDSGLADRGGNGWQIVESSPTSLATPSTNGQSSAIAEEIIIRIYEEQSRPVPRIAIVRHFASPSDMRGRVA